jgi:hypothetical protein
MIEESNDKSIPVPLKETVTKSKLEKERTEINNELKKAMNLERILISKRYSYYGDKNNDEYKNISKETEKLNKKIVSLKAEYKNISDKIRLLDLSSGTIKKADINNLNYNFVNNYELDEEMKTFSNNISHLDKQFVESLDVILVSATFYNLFTLYINKDKYTVNRLLVDECNSIKGSSLIDIPRIFTWFITSSITSLMTSTGYTSKHIPSQNGYYQRIKEKTIMSTGFILDTVKKIYENMPENYKIYLLNNPEYIDQSMTLPEFITIVLICKNNVNIQILNGIVSHDIMKMLNAGDIEGIVTKLDVVVGNENNIIEIITRKYQDELKVKEYELKVAIENPKYVPTNESQSIINKRNIIKELKYKISCISERIKDVESCPICYDDFTNPAITICCNNKFCFDCIAIALNNKNSCPSCRYELSLKELLIVSEKSKEQMIEDIKTNNLKKEAQKPNTDNLKYDDKITLIKHLAPEFSKYDNMNSIFDLNKNNEIKKYLIFTEYESTLNSKITNILDKWGLIYGRIKGTGTSISKQVENYKTGNVNVLLINSKYFGSGMNLENTSDIIIIHKMNSDVEMQVIGRAQRFGRTGNLRIWKLYYQNEA